MGKDNLPFTFYDFLGYFVPGCFFCFIVLLIFGCDIQGFMEKNIFVSEKFKDGVFLPYMFVILFAYLVGHLLSFLSSQTVEVYSIWTLDYPLKYLLGIGKCRLKDKFCCKKERDLCFVQCFFTFIARCALFVFLLPLAITDFIARIVCGAKHPLGRSLDNLTKEILKDEIKNFYKTSFQKETDLEGKGEDYFNIIYHYALENCPAHAKKMQNYVALYGFLRTLCFSFNCLTWTLIAKGCSSMNFSQNMILGIAILAALTGILYLDFNKFFRKFSVESLYALLSLKIAASRKASGNDSN